MGHHRFRPCKSLLADAEAPEDFTKQFFRFHLAGHFANGIQGNPQVNGRKCTVIQVVHPTRRDYFDFHVAQIFVDDQLQVPIRYAAYDWPASEGERPALIEEYTYLNLKVNVGLSDADFDVTNKNYNFE